MPFPRGLYWSEADRAPEAIAGHRYVGRLFFEMLIPAQVIFFSYAPADVLFFFWFTDSMSAFQVIWRSYTAREHEDVPEIARDRAVFDRDI